MARLNVKDYFKDIHKDQDIWIIAAGASLNYVSPSFFEGKITIGLNQSFSKYKHCNYYMKKDGAEWQGRNVLKHIKEVSPESKLIMSDYVGCAKEWGHNDFSDDSYVDFDYWYFDHPCGHGELDHSVLPRVLDEAIFPNGIAMTGIAIAMAAYMGAKSIIVCGNDTIFVDGKDYFNEYVDDYNCNLDHIGALNWGLPQTRAVANYFRSLGINVHSLNPFVDMRLEGHTFTMSAGQGN